MSCDSTGISLSVSNLSYGPHSGLTLIDSISFSIEAGDRLAIIGPNGAGKSTLLRCLFRAIKPTSGEILLDGQPLWSQAPREVARKVAVVLQEMPADFPFSVRDVVMMGRIPRREGLGGWSDKDRFEVEHAMEHLHLQKLAKRQFSSLSGGEKQRVLVARALAQEPELILLDEPTNHLDIRHQLEILAMLRGLGLTIVTSLHDINLAADFATHVAIMEHGRMTGFGSPDDVMTPSAISSAFGIAALAHRSDAPGATRFSFELHS